MFSLAKLQNLDLISVGLATAAIGILGFVVFFSNRKSITNRTFLLFAIWTILYGTFNYANYKVTSPIWVLWLLRLTLFSAVWHAFSFFQLFYVFGQENTHFKTWYKFVLVPLTAATSALTLTPLVFSGIRVVAGIGQVTNPERGPGIAAFGAVVTCLVAGGLIWLARKTFRGTSAERRQTRIVLAGALITFSFIILFNFIFPVILNDLRFIPLAPVFMLPFIVFTAYAIGKYRMLDIKVVTTETMAFVLTILTLFDVLVADTLGVLLLRVGIFMMVLIFSILLIKSVIREVEQRQKLQLLTEELKAANVKLQELDKLKSQFLSFASHQVKTPMTAVKGFATLIFDGTYQNVPDDVKDAARKIRDSADRMINLVNDILNLRKIEEGKMEYAFETGDVAKLTADVVAELQPLASKKNLSLTLQSPSTEHGEHVDISMDQQKFRQVIQNLTENAIKYTDSGWVKVTIASEDRLAHFSVSDSGHGMPKELLPELFEQFKRSQTTARTIEGTGLGLYIAKQIVLAHKGEIWAESDGPGKGSTFHVKIPLS